MPEHDDRYLGIDLGTSAIKLVVIDAAGRTIGQGQAGFPSLSKLPGQVEQGIADWWHALGQAAVAARASCGADWNLIRGIGLAGQLPTLVCLEGQHAWPQAIVWADSRADSWAEARIDAATRKNLYERTGMPIDGRYLAPMLRFHHADAVSRPTSILSAKDWLCWALTGVQATDPSTAAGYGVFDLASGTWAEDLCAFWQLDPRLLPPIKDSGSVAGPLNADAAKLLNLSTEVLVHVGAADSVAGAFALSRGQPETVCITMGSSTIIMGDTDQALLDPDGRYLLTPHMRPHCWGREMDLLSTGTGHQWLTKLLACAEIGLDALAAQSVAGARGIAFAPYLAGGEQGALWDAELTAVLHGLRLYHDRSDIARAFLEGVQFEIRRCIEVLADTVSISRVVVAGGITGHPTSVAMLADILNRPVIASRDASPAARGAAMALRDPPGSHPIEGEVFRPTPEHSEAYDAAYRRYLSLFPRVAKAAGCN